MGSILLKLYRRIKYPRRIIYGKIGKKNIFRRFSIVSLDSDIGNYNYIGSNSIISSASIGNYCSIAPNVLIGPANHPLEYISTSSHLFNKSTKFEFDMFKKKTRIGNDVWIGANVVVLQGVTIGDGAVIGANSFVNKDVPAFSVFAGCPAKFIKSRFNEEEASKIISSKWWESKPKDALIIADGLWSKLKENDNK